MKVRFVVIKDSLIDRRLFCQLDEMADEEVYRLRQAMDAAVEADKLAIEEQRPAIEKLKMLNEVIAVLQK